MRRAFFVVKEALNQPSNFGASASHSFVVFVLFSFHGKRDEGICIVPRDDIEALNNASRV